MKPLLRTSVGMALLLGAYVGGFQALYAGKILPGTSAGSVSLGGKTTDQAKALLQKKADGVTQLSYQKDGRTFTVPTAQIGLQYDLDATVDQAFRAGRTDWLERVSRPLGLLTGASDPVPVYYALVESAAKEHLAAQTKSLAAPAQNASIVRSGINFRIVPEKSGTTVDPVANLAATRLAIQSFQVTIPLLVRPQQPEVRARDLSGVRAYAAQLAASPMQIRAGSQSFTAQPETVAAWIGFEVREQAPSSKASQTAADPADSLVNRPSLLSGLNAALGVDATDSSIVRGTHKTLVAVANVDAIGEYVAKVADAADQPPSNARLSFRDNQLQVEGEAKDGQVVERSQSVGMLAASLKNPERRAELPVVTKKAEITRETLPTLGIKSLIGSSTTNFVGSSADRNFNIAVGASRFDGMLIKPGETFSFNRALGDVGPETGYVPELVILEKKTEKQYGGGLCQVSTTMFRAAMGAGLPIVDRTNHSYAVRYYEPIGMDATIYPPNPDLKFKNNTPGYILVQTRQVGTSVTFDFYGSPDGRQSSAEIMYINATEAAGGTAAFRYTVTGGPEPINRVFYSTYKPQAAFPVSDSLN